jgi:hypothetical protein
VHALHSRTLETCSRICKSPHQTPPYVRSTILAVNYVACMCIMETHTPVACRNEDQEAAQQYLLASAAKYGESLRWNPNNPQVGKVLFWDEVAQSARA